MSATKKSTPTGKSKPTKSSNTKKRNLITIVLVAGVVLLFLALLGWLLRNPSLYVGDQSDVKTSVTQTLDNSRITAGKVLHTEVNDLGCDSSNSVGLKRVVHCEVEGLKFFASQGDPSGNLKSIEVGFKKEGLNKIEPDGRLAERDRQILSGVTEGTVSYSDSNRTSASLEWATVKPASELKYGAISKAIRGGKLSDLQDGTVVIAVSVTETYWSCSSEAFKLLCPEPPSAVR